jgi:hypothetical protein
MNNPYQINQYQNSLNPNNIYQNHNIQNNLINQYLFQQQIMMLNNQFNQMNLYKNNNNQNLNNSINQNIIDKTKKTKKVKRLDPSEYTNIPLENLSKNILNLGKDQGGCRYLQKLLDENPKETILKLYQPLCENIITLINDPFGNYLIQKMFSVLSEEQLLNIMYIISPYIYDIGCNPHGTRALQSLISNLKSDNLQQFFLKIIFPHIIGLLKELNGTHVVQKFASDYPTYSVYINKIIIENSANLATHRHGCCVIQKYLETSDENMLNGLINKLIDNTLILIIDQFGNYVIQTVLLMGNKNNGNKIASKITENICYYAKHKYSSNVVEKCFDFCDGITKQKLINSILKTENIIDLIIDEHGNYVVQKVLALSNNNIQKQMLSIIITQFDKLKMLSFGERIINRLLASYPDILNMDNINNYQLNFNGNISNWNHEGN